MKKTNFAKNSRRIDSDLGMNIFIKIALLFIAPIRISNPETGNIYKVKKFRDVIYIVGEDENRPYTRGRA